MSRGRNDSDDSHGASETDEVRADLGARKDAACRTDEVVRRSRQRIDVNEDEPVYAGLARDRRRLVGGGVASVIVIVCVPGFVEQENASLDELDVASIWGRIGASGGPTSRVRRP